MLNMKITNRRKFHRINLSERVDLEFSDDSYDCCQIKNLSLTGMFVSGKFPQKQEETCKINLFHKTKTSKTRLHASAIVVWGNEMGVGLKFTSMTHDSYMLLLATLINNAEQSAIILHEFPKSCPFELESE